MSDSKRRLEALKAKFLDYSMLREDLTVLMADEFQQKGITDEMNDITRDLLATKEELIDLMLQNLPFMLKEDQAKWFSRVLSDN